MTEILHFSVYNLNQYLKLVNTRDAFEKLLIPSAPDPPTLIIIKKEIRAIEQSARNVSGKPKRRGKKTKQG
jgi:hypothetical protein